MGNLLEGGKEMKKLRVVFLVALCLAVALPALAEQPGKHAGPNQPRPMIIDNTSFIDANTIQMVVTNHGSFAYDLTAGASGLFFPKGTEKTAVYASGLWIGCLVNGQISVAVGGYSQAYGPGPMTSLTEWADPSLPKYRVYKIVKGDTTSADYLEWPVDDGAPVDEHGKPLLIGDQTLWCVYNDADPTFHNIAEGSENPLGVEIQQTTFGFDWAGALGNTVFIKFKVINKGTNTLDSTFFAVWADPDLGGSGDDYVGCDTTLSVGFCYNATNTDNIYGSQPPCVGYDFFQGPIGDDGIELPMTSFNKYINGTDPLAPKESYNYMKGLFKDGTPVTDPTTGGITRFQHPGDPVANTGWLDSDPADRRFMISAGPFTMAPGDTQNVVIGIIIGQGPDRIGSVRVMKFYDQTAQTAFNLDFDLPTPPDKPQVELAQLNREIDLSWGTISEIPLPTAPGYTFEGYNVYQSASISAAGPFTRIATYDLVDDIATIEDLTLDINFGLPIVEPVQFGTDSGIKRYIQITDDKVKGVPLSNGTPYYYRISAYSYNPNPTPGLPKTLEGFSPIIRAVPQEPPGDATILQNFDDCNVVHKRVDTNIAASTDKVVVTVVDPFALTGHTYRVVWQAASPPETVLVKGVRTPVFYVWNLKDMDTGLYLYDTFQTNKTGDNNYEITDGFVAKVVGLYQDNGVQGVDYTSDGCHLSDILGNVDAGLGFSINGAGPQGAGYGFDFRGSTLDPAVDPQAFTTVEIRFSHTETQKAYWYKRNPPDNDYPFQGVVDVPFTVWDVNTTPPTQLNAGFVQSLGSATLNGTWDPDASSLGGREYLFIDRSTYDPAGNAYNNDARAIDANGTGGGDVLYGFWVRRTSEEVQIPDGSVLRVLWAKISTPNDYFEFTPTAESFSTAKGKNELENIRVVPNPYFSHSGYELDQFHHVIKFSNLPRVCTIRIFNLSGDLIKTIEKTDPNTSIAQWDLFTEAAIPVASGFYIFHVEAPGIGSTFGKMAIFLEKERLNTF